MSLLPPRIQKRIEPPDRPRDDKITTRLTLADFRLLRMIAKERRESASSLLRKIVLARLPMDSVAPERPSKKRGAGPAQEWS